MASLGRGLRLPGLRPLFARSSSVGFAVLRSRLFSSSPLSCAAGAGKTITKTPKPAAPSAALSRYAFMKNLATKPTPTTLYESSSHFWFYFGCWSSGVSIITWTMLTGPAAMKQPDNVPQWVGLTFGGSYFLLCCMGFYLITKTPNIVGKIRVLPAQLAGSTKAGATSQMPLNMEVTVKRMVPFLQPKVITTPLDKVTMQSRFSLPDEFVPELKRIEKERAEEAKRRALWKFDMEHLFTMPFRRMGRAFAAMFQGVKAAWTDIGFGYIEVDGKRYKVDVTKGFAHDGFRTLEKLVEIKP